MGALVVLVAVQLSVLGLYLPPVLKSWVFRAKSTPNDHFTAGPDCRVNTIGQRARWSMLVAVQLSVLGLYLPPVFNTVIISTPNDHFTAGPDCRVIVS